MFANNDLDKVLKDLGVQTLVLAGVATDMVVIASAWDASDRYYNLVVPSDASAGANKASCDAALANDQQHRHGLPHRRRRRASGRVLKSPANHNTRMSAVRSPHRHGSIN